MISLFGKNSIYDDFVLQLRDEIYNKFNANEANIYDIVECFNSLLTVKMLTEDDL